MNSINPNAKLTENPIEAMNMIGSLRHRTVDVNVDEDFTITLRSLGAKDETETFVECMNYWGQAFLYKHKIETISRAIVAINEKPLVGVSVEEKKNLIGNWHQGLIDELYYEYAKLIGDIDNFLEKMSVVAETNAVGSQEAAKQKETLNSNTSKID